MQIATEKSRNEYQKYTSKFKKFQEKFMTVSHSSPEEKAKKQKEVKDKLFKLEKKLYLTHNEYLQLTTGKKRY